MFLPHVYGKIHAETSVQLESGILVLLKCWAVRRVFNDIFYSFYDIKSWNLTWNPYKFVSIASVLKTKVTGKQSRCHSPYSRFNSVLVVCYFFAGYTLTLHRSIILGNWYLILSFDLLREKIFTTIDLFSIIHKCIKIRFQNCNWLPQTAPQNLQRICHFDAIQIKKNPGESYSQGESKRN